MKKNLLVLSSLILLCISSMNSQVLITGDGSYAQNFDALLSTGLTNTWTDNTTIANVYSQRTSTSVAYAANDGASTTGGLYSYGTTATTERAIGTIGSSNTSFGGSFAHGILLQNTSSLTITDLKVSYSLEQWRNNQNITPNTITFWYKISSTTISNLTPGSSTGWTAVTVLNTNSPINTATSGALNGNSVSNRVSLTNIQIPSLSLPNGSFIMLRWLDIDHQGSDHGLAIDDVTIAWTAPCNTPTTYFQDSDNDGFGNANVTLQACTLPIGYTLDNTDCDDTNAAINPNSVWYADADSDSFGNANSISQTSCTQPVGYVLNNLDCDDTNIAINALLTLYLDFDNDGFGDASNSTTNCSPLPGYVTNSTDCNDANNQIYPGAVEITGNGIDEDCSGADAILSSVQLGLYEFTQASACPVTATSVTVQPANATFSAFTSAGTNCSATANVYSSSGWNLTQNIDLAEYNQFSITAATCNTLNLTRLAFNHRASGAGGTPTWELRSSIDNYISTIASGLSGNNNNVNLADTVNLPSSFNNLTTVTFRIYLKGIVTNTATWRMDNVSLYGNSSSLPSLTYYVDADNDGFGNPATSVISCIPVSGYVTNNTDCDDSNVAINPTTVWFMDMDNDTFGDASMSVISCTQPPGYVLNNLDCNDNDAQISGSIMYYTDADTDGFGDFSTGSLYCTNPGSGFVTNSTDCNDTNNTIYPGAIEICDGVDNDCVGGIDNGLTFVNYYTDLDLDGFGSNSTGQSLCQNPGAGFVTIAGDCNDSNDQINPDSPEICDGVDNDCAGGIDNGLTFVNYYTDSDNDGFGTGNGQSLCANPGTGFVTLNGDCNDNNNQIYPGATEILDNSIDENCDGVDGYLGLENVSLNNFKIAPNPNNGTFTIQLNKSVSNALIIIQDLNGKVIQTIVFSGLNVDVNLNTVTTGIYFVKIQSENIIAVERMVIK